MLYKYAICKYLVLTETQTKGITMTNEMTIENVKQDWNMGLITLHEAFKFSKDCGYNMVKMGGKNWVWFKISKRG